MYLAKLTLRLPLTFIFLFLIFGCENQARAAENAVITVPILEDVQPKGLAEGELWMALPLDATIIFRGDLATFPIKVAGGPGTNEEVTITMRTKLRSGQEPLLFGTGPIQDAHFVNGYSNSLAAPDGGLSTLARVSYKVPFTKYLRLRIHDDSPVGVYLIEFELLGNESKQRIVRHMRLAIYEGSLLQDIPVQLAGDMVEVEIRDDQGNPKSPDIAFLYGTRGDDEEVLLLHQTKPRAALHKAKINSTEMAEYDWTLVIYKRGYRDYKAPVKF